MQEDIRKKKGKRMSHISLKILNKLGDVLSETQGEDEINLVYRKEYTEGDKILLEVETINTFYYIQFDDAKGKSLVYITGNVEYEIPFGEKRRNISSKIFSGDLHLLSVQKMPQEELLNYRNLSENVWDQHGVVNCYPHASANVETRGESVFAAQNAIDGVTAAESHGDWPYQSWGINRRDDATWKIEFGRPVEMNKLIIYTRADFPHDNWWEQATITFSDGTKEVLKLKKGGQAQSFEISKNNIEWLELSELIKADDPSPFPALIQLQVFGRM